ncbi:MAG: DUF2817 domain-containing protein [bacterium]|nr:DUF2817 domain-containing protein [bacterium]
MEIELLGNKLNPSVIVIGVFHGDEPQGNYLIRMYFENNNKTSLLMLPCLNKYGFENNKRTNKNGVDLNRNFPTKNWTSGELGDYYGGKLPSSEEETKFVISLIDKYKPKAILSLHSPYKVVNYDGGASGDGKKLAEKISEIINYPVEENIGYPTPGSFGTWAGIEKDIPIITLELDENETIEKLKNPIFKIFKMLENY